MKDRAAIDIGVMLSTSGSYSIIGESMLSGAILAIEEINAAPDFSFTFVPHIVNPDGILSAYFSAAQSLLNERQIVHVVGCYTSSSRKEVLPLFEKNDALLWYPSHYEGFETT